MFLYKITNILNGDFYIGKTISEDPYKRFKCHIRNAFINNIDTYLYKAMRKYEIENFKFEVIFCLIDKDNDSLNEFEKRFISMLKPCYNMTEGGDGGRTADSPKFIQSMIEYHSTREYHDYATYGFKGRHHYDDTKDTMRMKRRNFWKNLSEEEYRKICNNMSGEKNSMYGKVPKNAIKIKYKGVIYNSLAQAVRETGLKVKYLKENGEIIRD